jgi:hypothetical protein
MSGQSRAAEWEYLVEGDLAPHLVPRRRADRSGRTAEIPRLPDGAYRGIAASLGPVRSEDLLVIPAAAWPLGGWRRRCLYSPLCVAAIGEQAVGLWVRDLPLPEVRARVALDDVALVEHRTAGLRHALTVTARTGTLVIRYDEDQRPRVDAWTRRLRLRVGTLGNELIIEQSWWDRRRPWRQILRTLYVPRRSVSSAAVRGRTLRLESAGRAVRVRLTSRKAAAAAWTWLESGSEVRGLTPPEGVTGSP